MKTFRYIFLITFFLCCSTNLLAQQYELNISGIVGEAGSSRCGNKSGRGLRHIDVIYADGTERVIFNTNIPDNGSFSDQAFYSQSNRVVRLRISSGWRKRSNSKGCSTVGSDDYINISNGCTNFSYNTEPIDRGNHTRITGIIDIKPIVHIKRQIETEDLAGYEDPLVVLATNGFNSSIYKWQYKVQGTTSWTTILPSFPFIDSHELKFIPKNYFPIAEDIVGKRVEFRILSCTGKPSQNIVDYKIIRSAPHIINNIPEDVACFDGKGSVKIRFDRALEKGNNETLLTGDNLNISIVDLSDKIGEDLGVPIYMPVADSTNITVFDEGNYITVTDLPLPFKPELNLGYRINLRGRYNDELYYTGDPNHTAVFSLDFPEEPVDFKIERYVNNWCKDDDGDPETNNDGEIHISASGGRNGSYEYKIFEGTTAVTNAIWSNNEGWNTFEDSNTHEIKDRKPNTPYQIRVRKKLDNGVYCLAKEIGKDIDGKKVLGIINTITSLPINEPAEKLQVESVEEIEPKAFGFTNGSIKVKIFGGTILDDKSYTFLWTGKDINGNTVSIGSGNLKTDYVFGQGYFVTLENIPAGTYKLTVTDKNYDNATYKQGCSIQEAEFTLEQPEKITIAFSIPDLIKCHNDETVTLTANATGGVQLGVFENEGLPYHYIWKKKNDLNLWDILPETKDKLEGIGDGEYSVNVIDANGITRGTATNNIIIPGDEIDEPITIIEPDKLEILHDPINDVKNVSCFGGNDGAINIGVQGGTTPYTYEWTSTSLDGKKTTEDLTTLIEGFYTVKITDKNKCTVSKTVEIKQPEKLIFIDTSKKSFQPTAFGFTNGWLEISVQGGTPFSGGAYNYVWKDGAGNTVASTKYKGTANADGTYTIRLEDIAAGNYDLIVTDDKSCTINTNFILEQPEKLTLSVSENHFISCKEGDDGQLIANAAGGVKPYTYTWKKKNVDTGAWDILPNQTSNLASGLSEGEYAVNIEDKNKIIIGDYTNNILTIAKDKTHHLIEPTALTIGYYTNNLSCFQSENGSINITVEGGTPHEDGTYTYMWSNGSTTEDISGLEAGKYTVLVTDSRSCEIEEIDIEISQPNELIVNYPSATFEPTAFGSSDGWIEATVIGGTALAEGEYNYEWKDGDGNIINPAQSEETFNKGVFTIRLKNLETGQYTLTITDANYSFDSNRENCGKIDLKFGLNEPTKLEVEIKELKDISCNQQNEFNDPWKDGILIAEAEGGVVLDPETNDGLPYYYTWVKKGKNDDWQELDPKTSKLSELDAGEYSVNIKDKNEIEINKTFILKEPDLLEISFKKQDVFCYGGNDGWAEVIISGGTEGSDGFKIFWKNGDTTIKTSNLEAGVYKVIVEDEKGCRAEGEIEIKEPIAPLKIEYTAYGKPNSIGESNAWIEAKITGGTPFESNTYEYSWVNENGDELNDQVLTGVIEEDSETYYRLQLNNIPSGTYYLTIKDKNYAAANSKAGCTIIYDSFTIHEPIEAEIEVLTHISCNQTNEFLDTFDDGQLITTVNGGVPFTTGPPYIYHWKKQDENGIWQPLTDQNTHIASGLTDGNFALNVEDSLGNVIGIYQSNELIEAIDVNFYFKESELLELKTSSTIISCTSGKDGSATVSISGGEPGDSGYKIEWSNGETTKTIKGLIAGIYFVYVTDSRGCKATGTVKIEQPGGINIETNDIKNPTCYNGNDGLISAKITGGTPPYKYLWSTNNITSSITNLKAGEYTLKVIDAEKCIAYFRKTLINPEPVIVNLGDQRTICAGQNLNLDITIDDQDATYLWESDNGFTSTSPLVELTKAGNYKAIVTTSLGCVGYDEVKVKVSQEAISAKFLLGTQAFADHEVILVNTSSPIGEKVEWTVPESVKIVYKTDKKLIVSFTKPGTFNFSLRSYQGDCYADYDKKIIVSEATEFADIGDTKNPFIEDFLVYPNPSDGNFKVKLSLAKETDISIKIISMVSSQVVDTRSEYNQKEFLLDYNLNIAPGLYILLLETPEGDRIRKIIIK